MPPAFSVFLPVYNEEALLETNTRRLHTFLASWARDFEILIGSNGSTDQTPAIGKTLAAQMPNVQFFHRKEKGPGLALRDAIARMKTDRLIAMDMDLSVELQFIPQAVEMLEMRDIVVGSKKQGTESRSLLRHLGSDLFIACSHRLLKLPFDDYSLGAKGYRKAVLDQYAAVIGKGSFYVQHLIYNAHHDQKKIVQIPVTCDDHRESRFNLLHEGVYRFGLLFWLAIASRGQR